MGDSNAYGPEDIYPTAPRTPAQYKFSQDELRVIQECNTESFLQRSLPLGTAFGMSAFFAVQKGHLKPNPRWGAVPKVTLAVIAGYFLGKLSYQQACAEKLMALPNSYIGQLLREKKEGRSGIAPKRSPTTMFGVTSEDVYSDAGPGSALDLDINRPVFSEDTYRPTSEGGSPSTPELAPTKPSSSYDDLRRRNRGEYADSRQDPYKIEPTPPISRAKPQPEKQPTNKYGDVME